MPQIQSCKALIIDVRDNGGGNIHQQLIDILSRKPSPRFACATA